MSLYSYQILQLVVKQKSFSKAAELLHLSPSAISHAIGKLEEEFGFPLLIRSKKTVVLSEYGLQVYRYIQDILHSSEMLEKRVAQINGASIGIVKFGVIDSIAVNWLPNILKRFQETFPSIEIQIQENGYKKLIDDVISHALDIAIVSHSSIQHAKTPLQFIPLYEDRLVCLSPKEFVPENKTFLSADELNKLPLILPQDGNEADIKSYFQEQNLQPQACCTVISNTSLAAMVRCGFGHAISPDLTLRGIGSLEDLRIDPIVPFGFRTLGAITQNPKFLTPAVRHMLSCITHYVDTLHESS